MGIAVGGILFGILFFIGLAFLIPGIVGTAITGKIKHSPAVLRVFSILFMVFGIILCAIPFLVTIVRLILGA